MLPTELNLFFVQCSLQSEDSGGWKKFIKRSDYQKHRVAILHKERERYVKNPAPKKTRYWENRNRVLEQKRLWRIDNPDKAREADLRSNVPTDRTRARDRAYVQRLKESGPEYKLLHGLRNRIRLALKNNSKAAKTRELLGMGVPEFKRFLQDQFRPGMTWENYGPIWHIDHIRPCASFDLSDTEQQRECFHYSNLQPLFAGENLRKGGAWSGGG